MELDGGQVFAEYYSLPNQRCLNRKFKGKWQFFCSIALRSRYNSSRHSTDFPRNYMANLTYENETSHPMENISSCRHHIQVPSRYVCGSARKFLLPDGSRQDFVTLTCQWDKTWSPGIVQEIPVEISISYGCFSANQISMFTEPSLPPCEWVACLQPPQSPLESNLRADWCDIVFITVRWSRNWTGLT